MTLAPPRAEPLHDQPARGKAHRQTCTAHCTACGRHFHGDGAFDLHRRDFECRDPVPLVWETGGRVGQPVFNAWTTEGVCDLSPGCWRDGRLARHEEPVTIWQRAASVEAKESLSRLRSRNLGVS